MIKQLLSLSITAISFCNIQESKVVLLSYPRSGNTFTRYCIESLTKRPTSNNLKKNDQIFLSYFQKHFPDLMTDGSKPIVIKSHGILEKELSKYTNHGLILLLRNYKEALVRHQIDPKNSHPLTISDDLFCPSYTRCIHNFCNWPNNNKLVIYYEDCIDNPELFIRQIVNFFQSDQNIANEFLASLDHHRERVLKLYDKVEGSKSQGKATNYHRKQLPKRQKLSLDRNIIRNTPKEFVKEYLIRYLEKESLREL
jgi:hypothetical protein